MDRPEDSIIWNESDADIVPSFTSTLGWRIWRMEDGENSPLFYGVYEAIYSLIGTMWLWL